MSEVLERLQQMRAEERGALFCADLKIKLFYYFVYLQRNIALRALLRTLFSRVEIVEKNK